MRRTPSTRTTALLVAATLFMEHLDGTILVTAAPQIAADFGVASADVGITMTGYLVAVACAIPLGGWLASRFGARLVFCLSIGIFVAASVLCALSPNLWMLLAARALQGVAGGMMVPVGRLVVLRATDSAGLVKAIALITWPALLAPVLAPALGGVITELASWHWIFIINVPIGAAAFCAALLIVRDTERDRRALDWPGLLLCTAAVLGVMAMVEFIARDAVVPAVASAIIAFAGSLAAVAWMLKAPHPLLQLRVLSIATFRVTNSGGFVFRMVVSSVPFLLPLLFQDSFGWGPIESGLAVTALFLGNIGAKPATTWLMRTLGFRTVLLGSVAGLALTLVLFALFTPAWAIAAVWIVSIASGAVRSIGFTAYNSIQFADVPRETLSSANSLSAMLAQLSAALGIAIGATVLRVADAVAPEPQFAYPATFVLLAALLVLPLLGALRLPGDAARHVSGARR